jgi:hypothetical protein
MKEQLSLAKMTEQLRALRLAKTKAQLRGLRLAKTKKRPRALHLANIKEQLRVCAGEDEAAAESAALYKDGGVAEGSEPAESKEQQGVQRTIG